MDPVGHHGLYDPFSRSNDPRSVHTPLFKWFSCAIANNFLGDPDSDVKNAINFVDVCQDLGYSSGWPLLPFRPIFKVKRASKGAYTPFRWFLSAIANHLWVIRIPTSKVQIFFVDVHQYLVYAAGWLSRMVRSILKVKRAPKHAYPLFRLFSCAIANNFLIDPDSDTKMPKNCMDVCYGLVYASDWPSRPLWPIFKVK